MAWARHHYEVHDMADYIVARPDILRPYMSIVARELQVPTVAGARPRRGEGRPPVIGTAI